MNKNLTAPLFMAALALAGVTGCSKPAAPVSTPQALANRSDADKQLLAQINALPLDQRPQFIQAHYMQYRHLMDDPDPQVRAGFSELIKHP